VISHRLAIAVGRVWRGSAPTQFRSRIGLGRWKPATSFTRSASPG